MQSEVRRWSTTRKACVHLRGSTFKVYESVQGEGGSQILMIFEQRTYFFEWSPVDPRQTTLIRLNLAKFSGFNFASRVLKKLARIIFANENGHFLP